MLGENKIASSSLFEGDYFSLSGWCLMGLVCGKLTAPLPLNQTFLLVDLSESVLGMIGRRAAQVSQIFPLSRWPKSVIRRRQRVCSNEDSGIAGLGA